jgi:3-phenylpropionate/trans-cinnamate dioxygenase ferredoxin subunit
MAEYSFTQPDDLEPGEITRIEVNGVALCVGRLDDGEFFAVADECTHEEIELSDGDLQGLELECPAHGSRFNVVTGEVRGLPATVPVKVYPIVAKDDSLVVEMG